MQDQLLGYVLGALDDSEQAELERRLETDVQLRSELELLSRCCAPLECDREHFPAPQGLSLRTCRYVESYLARTMPIGRGGRGAAAAAGAGISEALPASRGSWRFVDIAVAAGILIAATLLILPAISHSRFTARLLQCQNNLRELGLALHQFSHANQGLFPADRGNRLSAAAIFAPVLLEQGFLNQKKSFVCPGSEFAQIEARKTIPLLAEIQTADNQQVVELVRHSPGSYGNTLGYVENGTYRPTRNLGRATFALLSDSPCPRRDLRQSSNHNGLGQNVCYEDLHTDFRPHCTQPECFDKNIYRNGDNQLAPGLHRDDAVIVSARSVPLLNVNSSLP